MRKQKANNMNFHLPPNPEKGTVKIFGKTQRSPNIWRFWVHFAHFREKFFFEELGFVSFYILQLSTIMQNITKN